MPDAIPPSDFFILHFSFCIELIKSNHRVADPHHDAIEYRNHRMSLRFFHPDDEPSLPQAAPRETERALRPGVPLLALQAEARTRFENIAGLVFDMGDVLFDATVWRLWLLQLLNRMGLQTGYRTFYDVWDREYLDAVHQGRRDYAEAFDAFLRAGGLTRSQIDEVNAASQVRKARLEDEVQPFPGVRSTLARLHAAGIRMAVLSDSESTGTAIAARLTRMGLGGYFSAVVSSVDLGVTKPAREGYARAIELLEFSPARTAFVGHDADELRGARRAGMRTLAFNFERDAPADLYLGRFEELVPLFDRNKRLDRRFGEAA
jgi:HAD superfamily hydrolase (TIGR01509 family)